jgi:hypothetical protein
MTPTFGEAAVRVVVICLTIRAMLGEAALLVAVIAEVPRLATLALVPVSVVKYVCGPVAAGGRNSSSSDMRYSLIARRSTAISPMMFQACEIMSAMTAGWRVLSVYFSSR